MVAASTISKLIIVLLTVVVVMVVGNNLIHGPFLWVLNILHLPWGGSRAILTDEQAAKSVYEQFLENVAEFVNNDKAAQVFTVDVDTLSYPQDKVFFCIVGVHSSGKTTFSLKRSKSSEKDCIKSGNVIEKNISDKFNKYHYLFDMNSLFSSGGADDLLGAFQHLPICLQSPMSTGPIYFTFPLSTAPNDDKEWILLVRNPLITYLDSSFKIYDYSELDNSNSNENSLKKSITLKYPCVADQHYLSISHDFRYVGYGLYAISKSAISESKVDSLLKVENNLKSIPYHTLLFSCFEQKSKEPSNCGFIEHSWGLDPFYLKYLLCDESNSQSELCSEIEQFIEGKHYKENGMNVTQANCLAPESGFICNTADLYYQSHDYMTCTALED
ncbi:MAG: hypothetical protein GWP09_00135, partial [Nitrospiraceae bacterium]|nr:hypothetical protein [Nitrospiraceae bacterium]